MNKKLLGQLIALGATFVVAGGTIGVIGLTNPNNGLSFDTDEQTHVTPSEPEEVTFKSLTISKKPDKIMYEAGEIFDPTGMELSANYSDGTSQPITEGFTCSFINDEEITRPLDKSITQIKIKWNDKTAFLTGIAVRDKTIIGDTFRFEAEKSELISANTSKPYDCRYIDLADNASEGRCLNIRLEKEDSAVANNNGVSFKINSNQQEDSVEARLLIRVGMRTKYVNKWTGSSADNTMKAWVPYQKNFSEMYKATVNGTQMPFTNVLTAYGVTLGSTNSHNSFNEFNWRTVSTNVILKKGLNTINLTTASNTSTGPLDYIELVVPSGITLTNAASNITNHVAANPGDDWQILKEPTVDSFGYIGKQCSVCGSVQAMKQLPKLNPTDYTSCTPTREATATYDGVGTYTYEIDGQTLTFENRIIPATDEHHIYRYEAEKGHLEGESTLEGKTAISHVNNTIYEGNGTIEASDQGYVGNFGKTGNKLSFKIISDRAVTAKMSFRFSSVPGEAKQFSDLYSVSANNAPAFTESYEVPAGTTVLTEYSDVGFDWNIMTSYANLIQGENNIVFTINGEYDQHIDYLEIDSTANLTNETEGVAHHMCYFAAIVPNFEKFGLIVYGCNQCLMNRTCNENATFLTIPALNKTDYRYELINVGGVMYDRYTYDLNKGEEIHFDVKH